MYFCSRHFLHCRYLYSITVTSESWNSKGSREEFQGPVCVPRSLYHMGGNCLCPLESWFTGHFRVTLLNCCSMFPRKLSGTSLRQVCTFEPSPMTQTEIHGPVVALWALQSIWVFLSLRVLLGKLPWPGTVLTVRCTAGRHAVMLLRDGGKRDEKPAVFWRFQPVPLGPEMLLWNSAGHKLDASPGHGRSERKMSWFRAQIFIFVLQGVLSGQISTIKKKKLS